MKACTHRPTSLLHLARHSRESSSGIFLTELQKLRMKAYTQRPTDLLHLARHSRQSRLRRRREESVQTVPVVRIREAAILVSGMI